MNWNLETCPAAASGPGPAPLPSVAELSPYSPGRPLAGIDLYLDSNESPAPPAAALAALHGVTATDLSRYPSTADLEARLARSIGVGEGCVLVTAGADDGLERAVRTVCGPGRRAVLTTPTFAMLARYVRLTGAEAIETEWWSGRYPVDEVCRIAAGSDVPATLVAVVSPNNPTGATVSAGDLRRLLQRLPTALILLDHAYVELADEDLTELALQYRNVLVFRTFSKAAGLAGLRVGWVAGDERVITWLRCVGQPYAVSAPSLRVVEQLLSAPGSTHRQLIATIRRQRARLIQLLDLLGAEPLPSEANFVLARFGDAAGVRRSLAERGIAVRGFAGNCRLQEWLRITLPGDELAYRRLDSALREVLDGSRVRRREVAS